MHDHASTTSPDRSEAPRPGPGHAVALLERLDTGAALIDAGGVVRWCNVALAHLYDRTVETVVDRPVTELHEPDDNPYDHPDALRLEHETTAVYRFTRMVGERTLTHLLRALPAAAGDERWYVLEIIPDAPAALVRPGLFPEAALNADGRILVANDGFARLVGDRAHRLTGSPVVGLINERHADSVRRALRAAAADPGADPIALELCLARNDARPSWAELDLHGGPGGTVLVRARDVTTRKRDELLLAEVFDRAPQPHALIDPDGTIRSTNPAWRARFGPTDGDEAVDLRRYLAADTRAQLAEALTEAAAGRLDGFELLAVIEQHPADTFLARLRGTPLHDLAQRVDRLLISLDDLTGHAIEVESARRGADQVRTVLDALDIAVLVHEIDGTIRELNLGAHRLFGPEATELIGRTTLPGSWQACTAEGAGLCPDEHPTDRVLRGLAPAAVAVIGLRPAAHRPDGAGPARPSDPREPTTQRWFVVHARALTDASMRHLTGAVTSYSEITEVQAVLSRIRGEKRAALDAFDALPVAAYQARPDRSPRRISAALATLTGASDHSGHQPAPATVAGSRPAEAATVIDLTDGSGADGRTRPGTEQGGTGFADLIELVHPDDRAAAVAAFDDAAARGEPVRFHHRLAVGEASTPRWVDHQITPLFDGGTLEGFLGVLVPVPDWVAHGDRTRRLVRLVETTNDLVGEYDVEHRRVDYLNPRAIEVFEADGHRLDRLRLASLYGPDAAVLFRSVIWPALVEQGQWEGELPMVTADGQTIAVQQWITAERDGAGRIVRLAATGHDVTERSRREAELARRATHDPLTGLPNRSLLLERLDTALGRARRTGRLVGLAFLDLDRFKQINDRYGHDGGDSLLVQVANRVSGVLRPTDLVARLGGDEFVVLCDAVEDEARAHAVAERVAAAIGDRPYLLDGGGTIRVSTSLGLALSTGTDHPEALLRDADAALYRAKDEGRARIVLFDETMRDRAATRGILAEELRAALRSGAIAVHYQPSIDLRTGQVVSVEALARWQHPTRGLLQPSDFVDLAEGSGLLAELGEQVLWEAAERAHRWEQRFGAGAPVVQVNLPGRQIIDGDLVDRVQAALDASGLRPSLLCLTLSESTLLEHPARTLGAARDLKALGVQLAIEDLGTGRSSLTELADMPLDTVKIDRSFVEGLDPAQPQSAALATAVVALARALGLATVAAGVTTVTQLAELHRLGCDAAQGFYFSPPLEAGAIDSYLDHRVPGGRGAEPTAPGALPA